MSFGKKFSNLLTRKNDQLLKIGYTPTPQTESTQHTTNSRIGELVNEPEKSNPVNQSK